MFCTQKPISRVSYLIMTDATLFTLQLKGSHRVPVLICARSFAISTLKPSMARASDEKRGEKFGCEKKLEKNGLGKIWLGKLDVYIHIFVGVIFHLVPQHLSFGKLKCRIQSVMSSKLSWWLEWAPIQVQACHIKWDPRHRKSDPTRLNFPCPS